MNNNKGESIKKSYLQDRSQKMKEIDDLYREEIHKIYTESKKKLDNQNVDTKKTANDEKKSQVIMK